MNFRTLSALLVTVGYWTSGSMLWSAEPKLLLMDELSGDCCFGLIGLYGSGHVRPSAICVSYGTAPLDQATRNAQEMMQLLGDSRCRVYIGAEKPMKKPPWLVSLPRFYGLDGKVGVDLRALGPSTPRPEPVTGSKSFFQLLGDEPSGAAVVLCVLGPWTDIANELRHAEREQRQSYLENVTAIITVAGAFAVDDNGKSIGNEGAERQAEYNVYLDPQAFVEGVRYFNHKRIPVYDISWSFHGRWRLWRPLLETLSPTRPDDGAAWAALLLANGFYTFHGGNTVTAGGGIGQKAWMTADAHALLFAEGLCQHLRHGKAKIDDPRRFVHGETTFEVTPTDFVVVTDDMHPEQYGRTVSMADLPLARVKGQVLSSRLTVQEVSLSGNEQMALAAFLKSMCLRIDEPRWKQINQEHSGSLAAPVEPSPAK